MVDISRIKGALIGLRVGDGLGCPVEGLKCGQFLPVEDYTAANPKTFWAKTTYKAGDFSDDTSMAMCLAQSLIDCRGPNPERELELYRKWADEGYYSCGGPDFGMGRTTREVIERFKLYKTGALPFSSIVSSDRPTNGGLMRVAPAILAAGTDMKKAVEWAGATTATTHAHPDAVAASRLFGAVMSLALNRGGRAAFNRKRWEQLLPEGVPDVFQLSPVPFPSVEGRQAYTASTTLQAALASVENCMDFPCAVLTAVNLGGDTDTYGAVAGALCGAMLGLDAIPKRWWVQQRYATEILALADGLYQLSGSSGPALSPRGPNL